MLINIHCQDCDRKGVPYEKRTVLYADGKSSCGHCGGKLESASACSPIAEKVMNSLLKNGVFYLPRTPNGNVIALLSRVDDVQCTITTNNITKDHPNGFHFPKPWQRVDVSGVLPESVAKGAELVTKLESNEFKMHFDQASTTSPRKFVRFVHQFFDCMGDVDTTRQTLIEFTWTSNDESNWSFPTPAMVAYRKAETVEDVIAQDIKQLSLRAMHLMKDGPTRPLHVLIPHRGVKETPAVSIERIFGEHAVAAIFHESAIAAVAKNLVRAGWRVEVVHFERKPGDEVTRVTRVFSAKGNRTKREEVNFSVEHRPGMFIVPAA